MTRCKRYYLQIFAIIDDMTYCFTDGIPQGLSEMLFKIILDSKILAAVLSYMKYFVLTLLSDIDQGLKVRSYYTAIALPCRAAPSCTEITALWCRMKVKFILT